MPDWDHTPDRQETERRLREARIVWLGSVRTDGRPHLVPVWFLWTGAVLLIAAEPGSQKVANIRANPDVVLALDDSRNGHEPVILEGRAEIRDLSDASVEMVSYFEKYRDAIAAMKWSESELRGSHRALIRIEIARFVTF